MKILAISDNHGSKHELEQIIARHDKEIDYWVHCGDSEFSEDHPHLEKFLKVRGNTDFSSGLPNELVKKCNGIKVFVTHGHLLNVKISFLNLYYRAEELGAQIAFFGHSHIACNFKKGTIIFINPGSINLPRGRKDKSYVVCDINDNTSEVEIFYYNEIGEELTDLNASYKL